MASVFSNADYGPVMTTQLVSLSQTSNLRVGYNWLYSALYCAPGDNSPFYWTISKLNDTQVSLSPRDGYQGMTLYASARDDNDWFMQVQAPYSADWITAVGRDETLGIVSHDLLILSFTGFNGAAITVNSQPSDHDGLSGYRLQSLGGGDPKASLWALRDPHSLQPQFEIQPTAGLSDEAIAESLEANGLAGDSDAVAELRQLISP